MFANGSVLRFDADLPAGERVRGSDDYVNVTDLPPVFALRAGEPPADAYVRLLREMDAAEAAGQYLGTLYDQLAELWDSMGWEDRRQVNRAYARKG